MNIDTRRLTVYLSYQEQKLYVNDGDVFGEDSDCDVMFP